MRPPNTAFQTHTPPTLEPRPDPLTDALGCLSPTTMIPSHYDLAGLIATIRTQYQDTCGWCVAKHSGQPRQHVDPQRPGYSNDCEVEHIQCVRCCARESHHTYHNHTMPSLTERYAATSQLATTSDIVPCDPSFSSLQPPTSQTLYALNVDYPPVMVATYSTQKL